MSLAVEHLRLRLAELHHALRVAVDRQARAAAQLTRPDLTPFCVTDEQVSSMLDRVDAFTEAMTEPPEPPRPDQESEQHLRRLAAARGATLPLDTLATRFGLTRPEQDALLLVAAPELDAAYERIYAYIVDNLNRRAPCVELLVTVGGQTPSTRLALRGALGRTGRLRRFGLIHEHGDSPVELAQELALGKGVFDFLLGWATDIGLLGHDRGEVVGPESVAAPYLYSAGLTELAGALADGEVDLVGLWGCPRDSQLDAAQALAGAAGKPLRQMTADLEDDLRTAAALNALLWLPTDDHPPPPPEALLRSRVAVCLTGVTPWRPASLLAARGYTELTFPTPGFPERRAMWTAAFPALDGPLLEDLAARYRMSGGELRAVASVAGTGARLAGDGPDPIADHVEPAIATVTRGRNSSAVQSIVPRRAMADLVLPPAQRGQIMEIASAARAWPRIAETWGFARRAGQGGIKALFTGEPGTGKTMSAEVVTGMLGLELLKVDLAQVVSKWVGETEKNMEAVFQQAENSHAVLLFDEADALFGKRGDVKHGTDRYANLEVGYLLQRLEVSEGLVILTSNLKENIDAAFTRRFQFVVHFPRPGVVERRTLWRQAFPPEAPLGPDVDLEMLSRLDLTGAGIGAAARTAALTAADENSAEIVMRHVVRGISRQFQREARLFRPSELGPYAGLLADNGTPG
ncbi:ATP-binding protein [Actinophytocola sediminis]